MAPRSKPHSSRPSRKRSTIVKRDGEVLPADQSDAEPPTPRVLLHDIDSIRREMGSVYRDARRGQLETTVAARLVYMLAEIRKTYEVSVLERRLAALESNP